MKKVSKDEQIRRGDAQIESLVNELDGHRRFFKSVLCGALSFDNPSWNELRVRAVSLLEENSRLNTENHELREQNLWLRSLVAAGLGIENKNGNS